MNLILALLLSALVAYGEISFGTASRIRRGAGAPSSGDCAVASDVGKVYIQNDLAASGSPIFACSNSGSGTYSWQQASGGGGGGGGATTALDNLASVSINASLIPQSAKNLGAAATPWQSLCLYGSGTFGSHSWCTAGTPTGNRTITFPDASITVAGSASALTSTRVPFATTGGLLTDSAGLTFTDSANVRLATLAGGSSQSTNALFDITNSAGSSHWLTVLGDGKVGIGTNAPSASLEVAQTGSSSVYIVAKAGPTGNEARMNFNVPGSAVNSQWWRFGISSITSTFRIERLDNTASSIAGTPLTISATGIGIGNSNLTPTGISILDATPASGSTATWIGHDGSGTYSGVHLSALTTTLSLVAGLTQSTSNLQEWKNAAGTSLLAVRTSNLGGFAFLAPGDNIIDFQTGGAVVHKQRDAGGTTEYFHSSTTNFVLPSGHAFGFASTATAGGTLDTSLSRIGAGKIGFGTGAAGSVAGEAQAAIFSALGNGAASVPNILGSGTWFTGGSATTTKPYLLIEPSGTTSTGWSTSGTGIGVNAASGFAGNLLDLQVAGVSKLKVTSSDATFAVQVATSSNLQFGDSSYLKTATRSVLSSPANGNWLMQNQAGTDFTMLQFGLSTSAAPALKRSTTGLIARLADDSADTWVQASYLKISNTAESTCSSTTRGEIRMVQGSTGVADTFRVCAKNAADSYLWTALF